MPSEQLHTSAVALALECTVFSNQPGTDFRWHVDHVSSARGMQLRYNEKGPAPYYQPQQM
jgi:hypothetical protein